MYLCVGEDGARHNGLPCKRGILCDQMRPLWPVVKIQCERTPKETVIASLGL